jgi:hypothetical protein
MNKIKPKNYPLQKHLKTESIATKRTKTILKQPPQRAVQQPQPRPRPQHQPLRRHPTARPTKKSTTTSTTTTRTISPGSSENKLERANSSIATTTSTRTRQRHRQRLPIKHHHHRLPSTPTATIHSRPIHVPVTVVNSQRPTTHRLASPLPLARLASTRANSRRTRSTSRRRVTSWTR